MFAQQMHLSRFFLNALSLVFINERLIGIKHAEISIHNQQQISWLMSFYAHIHLSESMFATETAAEW